MKKLIVLIPLILCLFTPATSSAARYKLPENLVGENAILEEWFTLIESEYKSNGKSDTEQFSTIKSEINSAKSEATTARTEAGSAKSEGNTARTEAKEAKSENGVSNSKISTLETKVVKLEKEVKEDNEALITIKGLLKI